MSAILFRLKFRPDLAVRVSGPDTHEQKSKKVEESGEGFQDSMGFQGAASLETFLPLLLL